MSNGLLFESFRITIAGRTLVALDALVAPGEVLTVMGPSGSGKSTLLAVVTGTAAGVFEVSGRVCLDGRSLLGLPAHERRVGILFQDELLFPHLSVAGNLAFGLAPEHRGRATRRRLVEEGLSAVGLSGFAERDPATLSGGQKARVALLRTLLAGPRALLLDEPFSRLDVALRVAMRRLVFGMARDRGLPVLLVTHDPADAEDAGGPLIVLDA